MEGGGGGGVKREGKGREMYICRDIYTRISKKNNIWGCTHVNYR